MSDTKITNIRKSFSRNSDIIPDFYPFDRYTI